MRQSLGLVLVATAALGCAFVALVPPGLPYDEPSHWANVIFYIDHARMPELGEHGVTYEAQMGPLAYVVSAFVAAPLRLVSDAVAFYAVRSVGLLLHLGLVVLIWRLARRVMPDAQPVAALSAAAIGLNPMLLAMSTSIQNDTLSLVLAVGALDVATAAATTTRRTLLTASLVGAALLTKITIWPIVVVLGGWFLFRRLLFQATIYGASVTTIAGWWFVRNQLLYGDLTARAGVEAAGYTFPALEHVTPIALLRHVVTYLWLPTEYVRNLVEAPPAVEALVLLLSAAGAAGVLILLRRPERTSTLLVLAAAAVLAVAGWLGIALTTQAVAFRIAYMALPFWLLAVGAVATVERWRLVTAALTAALMGVSLWFLASVSSLPSQPFDIPL